MGKLYKIREVAEILRCSGGHVRDLCSEGRLGFYRFGSAYRIPQEKLEDFISRSEGQPRELVAAAR